MTAKNGTRGTVSPGRHERCCTVCAHPRREEIEHDFITWRSARAIAKEYGVGGRAAVYRHAHAFGLVEKRRRRMLAALEGIIERGGDAPVSATAVVAAVLAYARINAMGIWTECGDRVNPKELIERMSNEELMAYAREGTLPGWFSESLPETPPHSQEGSTDG